jgi:hypothetical protein
MHVSPLQLHRLLLADVPIAIVRKPLGDGSETFSVIEEVTRKRQLPSKVQLHRGHVHIGLVPLLKETDQRLVELFTKEVLVACHDQTPNLLDGGGIDCRFWNRLLLFRGVHVIEADLHGLDVIVFQLNAIMSVGLVETDTPAEIL